MSEQPQVEVRDEPERSRWAAYVDGAEAGFAEYELREDPAVVAFTHTVVHPQFEGQGVAGRIVRAAMESLRAQGGSARPVVAECSYVRGWLAKHPDFADLAATS